MSAAHDTDLVLAAFTVHRAGLVERCHAAATAGFDAISLRPADLDRARQEGYSLPEIATVLADHGLRLADLDAVLDWAPHHRADTGVPPSFHLEHKMRLLWEATRVLTPRSLNVVDMARGRQPLEDLAAGLATIARRAADLGAVVHLEQLSGSAVPDLATACAVARAADHPAAGVILDTWHHFRAGGTVDQVRDCLDVLAAVQVNDAPAQAGPDLREETMHHRLLPGDGSFPLVDTLRVVTRQVPIAVEVMSDQLWSRPPQEVAAAAHEHLTRVLTAATATEP